LGEPICGADPITAASERRVEISPDAADRSVCVTILAQEFSMRSGGLKATLGMRVFIPNAEVRSNVRFIGVSGGVWRIRVSDLLRMG
jgi:hypothetical protein